MSERKKGSSFSRTFLAGFLAVLTLSATSLLGAIFVPVYVVWFIAATVGLGLLVVAAIEILVACINLVSPEKERNVWDAREAGSRLAGLLLALLIAVPVLWTTCTVNMDNFCSQPDEETYPLC